MYLLIYKQGHPNIFIVATALNGTVYILDLYSVVEKNITCKACRVVSYSIPLPANLAYFYVSKM